MNEKSENYAQGIVEVGSDCYLMYGPYEESDEYKEAFNDLISSMYDAISELKKKGFAVYHLGVNDFGADYADEDVIEAFSEIISNE